MPSIRKRIGYLPSLNIHAIINKIAKKEQLSQSKVVGILVEEALIARGVLGLQNTNDSPEQSIYKKEYKLRKSLSNYNDLDELISDKGITYNTNKYNSTSEEFLTNEREAFNKDLFEQFKQFMLFQRIIKEK